MEQKQKYLFKTAVQQIRENGKQFIQANEEWLPRYNAKRLVETLWKKEFNSNSNGNNNGNSNKNEEEKEQAEYIIN